MTTSTKKTLADLFKIQPIVSYKERVNLLLSNCPIGVTIDTMVIDKNFAEQTLDYLESFFEMLYEYYSDEYECESMDEDFCNFMCDFGTIGNFLDEMIAEYLINYAIGITKSAPTNYKASLMMNEITDSISSYLEAPEGIFIIINSNIENFVNYVISLKDTYIKANGKNDLRFL